MNKTEICDVLVKQGIGSERRGYYSPDGSGYLPEKQRAPAWFERTCMLPEKFAADPRVAIAVMEKLDSIYPEKLVDESWQVQASINAMPTEWIVNDNLSAAIIEACVEALT